MVAGNEFGMMVIAAQMLSPTWPESGLSCPCVGGRMVHKQDAWGYIQEANFTFVCYRPSVFSCGVPFFPCPRMKIRADPWLFWLPF